MAQERVRNWAIRFVPEETDKTSRVKRIRCSTADSVLDTWDAPFAGREQWCDEMEALLEACAEQLAPRRHPITFTALDANDSPLSQVSTTIVGRNKDAHDLSANGGPKALADAMNALASTQAKISETANRQLESATKTIEALSEEVQGFMTIERTRRENEVNGENTGDVVSHDIANRFVKLAEENGPALLELLKLTLQNKNPTAAQVIGAVAATATNGKAPAS